MTTPSIRIRTLVAAVICATTLAVAAGPLATGAGAAPAATVTCPAAAGNARFVRWIYLQILDRCPGTVASTYWTAKLDGGLDRWAFTEAIDMSNENLGKNNIDGLYQGLLNRLPTPTERAAGIAHIRQFHQDGKLVAELSSTPEYYAAIPGTTPAEKDQAWLTGAFQGILDRDPDPGAKAYFTARLGSGGSTVATRLAVASTLERSKENATDWTQAVFFAGLNRPPDPAGFTYWITWLTGRGKWQTFRMWTHILSSNEGYARAETQPEPVGPESARTSRTASSISRVTHR